MIEKIQSLIQELNLPVRKSKSKNEYSVYLLKHDIDLYYFGVTKDLNKRIKQHSKTKKIIEHHQLFISDSLANSKIVECYLTLHYKLLTSLKVSNKRTESLML